MSANDQVVDLPFNGETDIDALAAQARAAAAAPPNPLEIKLDGDGIPEHLKGKTPAQLEAERKALADANRALEAKLLATMQQQPQQPTQVVVQMPAQPAAEKHYSDDEINALFSEGKHLEAMRIMQRQSVLPVAENIDARISGIYRAAASGAEVQARQAHPFEFQHFANEIKAKIDSIDPQRRDSIMSQPESWKQVVNQVIGENADKWLALKTQSNGDSQAEALRAAAGFSGPTVNAPRNEPTPSSAQIQLDAEGERIAQGYINQGVFKDKAEYIKWMQIESR